MTNIQATNASVTNDARPREPLDRAAWLKVRLRGIKNSKASSEVRPLSSQDIISRPRVGSPRLLLRAQFQFCVMVRRARRTIQRRQILVRRILERRSERVD